MHPVDQAQNQIIDNSHRASRCPYYNDDCPKCIPKEEITVEMAEDVGLIRKDFGVWKNRYGQTVEESPRATVFFTRKEIENAVRNRMKPRKVSFEDRIYDIARKIVNVRK